MGQIQLARGVSYERIEKFKPIIKKLSYKYGYQYMGREDWEQELTEYLITRLHVIEQVDMKDIMKIVYSILRNQVYTLLANFNKRRKLIYTDEIKQNDIDSQSYDCLSSGIESKELKSLINNYIENRKNKEEQKFLNECINPSLQLIRYWEQIKTSHTRFNNYEFIPPFTIGKFLGLSVNKVLKFQNRLKVFLNKNDYDC